MRILLVSSMVPNADGAGAIPVLLDAQLAALRGRHEITLVTGVGDEPADLLAANSLRGTGVELRLADRRVPQGRRRRWLRRARLASTWAEGALPWRTVWFGSRPVQRVLDDLAASRSFDLISVEDSAMAMLRLPTGVPRVLTEHEVRRPRRIDWHLGPPSRWPAWAFEELDWGRWPGFQASAWRRFDLVQVFSERDARGVAEMAPEIADRVRTNPFGLVLPPEPDPGRERGGVVLFVGNFTHAPNRDAALWLAHEIMPAVRARYPPARLLVVGSSPPADILDLSGPHVEVVSDAADIHPYFEAASVIVAPVRIGGGMRMKVLYALASGKAVVTTSRGVEGLNGVLGTSPAVVADDTVAIAAATAELLANGSRRRALGEAGRKFAAAHHSPEAWANRLEAVYEEARTLGRARDR